MSSEFLVCDCCQRCYHKHCCKQQGISTRERDGVWFHDSSCRECLQKLQDKVGGCHMLHLRQPKGVVMHWAQSEHRTLVFACITRVTWDRRYSHLLCEVVGKGQGLACGIVVWAVAETIFDKHSCSIASCNGGLHVQCA
jgi:hypothetical protein